MTRQTILKKIMIVSVVTACLGINFFSAEAAPPKKGGYYPYPPQQQSQQNNRPASQQPRPSSPRPSMQQPRPGSPRPVVHQQRTNSPRPVVHQQRTNSPRPVVQQQRTNSPRPVVQQQRSSSPRPVVQQQRSSSPRPVIQQPKPGTSRLAVERPKQHVAKPDTQKQKPVEQKVSRPRKDLHRPPIKRTYENMHVWRRPPKPPKDNWWNHRPAHRPGRYRGYYNGIYCTDVLSALLAAEIIHSSYYTSETYVNYADYSDYAFIPKEAIKFKGHHYLVFTDIGNSMEDAQQFCESMGGHLAAVGDEDKNERLYRLINDSGFDNQYFEKFGHDRLIPNEPVTYVKTDSDNGSEEEDVYYGLYYWNYKNLLEDGRSAGTGGNAFICEWDK